MSDKVWNKNFAVWFKNRVSTFSLMFYNADLGLRVTYSVNLFVGSRPE